MKALLPLIISGALVVSGHTQTRNVLVNTNNAVVQPTNFWSADASNARTGLGLGPTNSPQLNRLIVGNGTTANPAIQVGTNSKGLFGIGSIVYLAAGGNDTLAVSSSSVVVDGDISATAAGQTRTNFGLVWEGLTNADASSFRTALGLGTSATNPASAFQASSVNLTNLSANNGGSLTNIQATSLVGVIPASNISTVNFTNIGGTLSIASGGTGATNAANARQNLGSTTVGDAVFIATNAAAARTTLGATTVGANLFTLLSDLGSTNFLRINADNTVSAISASNFRSSLLLGTAATNAATNFQASSSALTTLSTNNGVNLTNIPVAGVVGALATNGDAIALTNFPALLLRTNGNGSGLTSLTAANVTGTVALASNVTGTIAISNGGSGATTAGGARTNFGLGESDGVTFSTIRSTQVANSGIYNITMGQTNTGFKGVGAGPSDFGYYRDGSLIWSATGANFTISSGLSFSGSSAGVSRTNLGIPWSGLTNTTASGFQTALFGTGTNPVLVNTNGEVVSPTNFWQVAPISTTVQDVTFSVNATNNVTNSRFLHVHSIGAAAGTTNTIVLPTDSETFDGDLATVVHQGTTSNATAVRQFGAATNLIVLNKFNEAVAFVYHNGTWTFDHNLGYTEPIYFSGTNAAANAAASRTNLGLGELDEPLFLNIRVTEALNTNEYVQFTGDGIGFPNETAKTNYRNSLGLGWPALTNTNAAGFQRAIFSTNAAPTNTANVNGVGFNTAVAWMEVSVITNGVTNSYRIPLFK